jgi:hypothetical protein
LQAPQLPLRLAGKTGIIDLLSRAEGCEGAQSHVDPYWTFICQWTHRLDFIHDDLRKPAGRSVDDPQEPLRLTDPLIPGAILDQSKFGDRE